MFQGLEHGFLDYFRCVIAIASAMLRHSATFGDGHSGFAADGPDGFRRNAGEVFIIYGRRDWPAEVDLGAPPGNATRIFGARANDFCGEELWSADLNGDGFKDLMLGCIISEGPARRPFAGAVHVIYGRPDLPGSTIDLIFQNSPGLKITAIFGESAFDQAGDSVRAYDINRDGLADLLIGSPTHSQPGRTHAGDVKLIFGQRGFLPETIDLAAPPNGLVIHRIVGTDGTETGIGGDMAAYSLSGGDVDGDGIIDFVVNAMGGDGAGNSRQNVGEVYVISGGVLSRKLGMLAPASPAPSITIAELLSDNQPVARALAGQPGLRVKIIASGVTREAEVHINTIAVPTEVEGSPSESELTINLDNVPPVRDSIGALVVQVRNLDPPSALSRPFFAGELVGPEIETLSFKPKGKGLSLAVTGKNFHPAAVVQLTASDGQAITPKKTNIESETRALVKIRKRAPLSGKQVSVRVINPNNVPSNEAVGNPP